MAKVLRKIYQKVFGTSEERLIRKLKNRGGVRRRL